MSIHAENLVARLQAAIFLRRSTRNQFLHKDTQFLVRRGVLAAKEKRNTHITIIISMALLIQI